MNKDFPESGASGVPPRDENDAINATTTAEQQEAAAVPKSRGGAPRGPKNPAWLHGLASKATARETRDAHRREAEGLVRAAIDAAGLADHPIARLLGRNLVTLLAAESRCEERSRNRGYFSAKGAPSPSFVKQIEIISMQLAEYRRLLEALTPQGTERRVVVTVIDDPNADDGSKTITDADLAAWEARRATPGSALGPRYDDLTLAARLAAGEVRLPDESTLETDFEDCDGQPQDVRPTGQRSPVQRRRDTSSASTPPKAPGAAHAPGNVEPEAPETLLEVFEDADRRMREHFDSGGSFGGLGRLF